MSFTSVQWVIGVNSDADFAGGRFAVAQIHAENRNTSTTKSGRGRDEKGHDLGQSVRPEVVPF